ncbi:hypothetical protein OG196_00305 [Kitasatospora purpeofusca]|uniref:hypothetical protein n=1 Tax=Kitasatospora purpeofusca TaxID=67352 RepID=UPI002E135A60|nr:hypothetical protein OG196_00305 [Kitasatospora purpeofusca]
MVTESSETPAVDSEIQYHYVAYRGADGHLWAITFDSNSEWSDNPQKMEVGITGSPAFTRYKGVNYCFHQGYSDDGKLWYGAFEYSEGKFKWLFDAPVPEKTGSSAQVKMSRSPSVVTCNGLLYCLYQGPDCDGTLRYTRTDGQQWFSSKASLGDGAPVAESPAAAVYTDRGSDNILVAYQGADRSNGTLQPDGSLNYMVMTAKDQWSDSGPVPNVGISDGPTLIPYPSGGKIYCLHQGEMFGEGWLWYAVFDGQVWSPDKSVEGVGLSSRPGAAVIFEAGRELLCCVHRGQNYSDDLWYSTFDGSKWSSDIQKPKLGVSEGPAVM